MEAEKNEQLAKYQKELTEDLNLNIHNLREKSMLISTIRSKWLNYYFEEKKNLSKAKALKKKIIDSKMSTLDKASTSIVRLKSEQSIIENDENIAKLNALIDIVKDNIDYIERSMNILNDLIWQVKSCIELVKLERL